MNLDQHLSEDMKERTATFLLDMHAHISAGLVSEADMEEAKAAALASCVVDHIRHAYGGETLYIPKGKDLDAVLLHHAIYKEFNGRNQKALAKKYNVSLQWVYATIKATQNRIKEKVQPALFDE